MSAMKTVAPKSIHGSKDVVGIGCESRPVSPRNRKQRSSIPVWRLEKWEQACHWPKLLVHGGFVDGAGWEGVYKILKRDGCGVSIVQNPTISLEDDVAVTKRTLAAQDG